MNKHFKLVLASSLLISMNLTFATPSLPMFHQGKYTPIKLEGAEEKTFTQLIDHNDPARGTFDQHYVENDQYAQSEEAPVFLFLCDQVSCASHYLLFLKPLAKAHGARMIAFEHRYYGASLPTPDISTENLRYLSTAQALADIENFQRTQMKQAGWEGKWVIFGGGYAGNLAAYYRMQHPNLVEGAFASSAPVMAQDEFPEFDESVTRQLPEKCQSAVKAAVNEVESALDNPSRMAEIKADFDAANITDNRDFLYLLASLEAFTFQGGQSEYFCKYISNGKTPLEGFSRGAKLFYKMTGFGPELLVPQGWVSPDPADYDNGRVAVGFRQWHYQACSEYGYWWVSNRRNGYSTFSKFVDGDYYQQVCHRLFGLEEKSSAEEMNHTYFLPTASHASHIFFTNGSSDPWAQLSLTDKNGTNPALDYYTIEGAAHGEDLLPEKVSDSESLKGARRKLAELVADWLD